MSSVPEIACESRVTAVVVYARGALVTRAVTLPPALPAGQLDLVIAGVTAFAEPGGVRAELEGAREIVALRARLFLPEAPQAAGALTQRLTTLGLEREAIEAERQRVTERRAALGRIALTPEMRPSTRRGLEPAAHFGDALAAGGLVSELVAELDARSRELDAAFVRTERALEAAHLAAAQGGSAERAGALRPTFQFVLRLASSGASVRALSVTYPIAAARWWPAYAARLAQGATRAEWALGALVAQSSGEDWSDVRLSLSTADLAHDARLPELASLRLGRAQPPPRKGYRPAPPDLDTMFAAFDRAATPGRPPSPTQSDRAPSSALDLLESVDESSPITASESGPTMQPMSDARASGAFHSALLVGGTAGGAHGAPFAPQAAPAYVGAMPMPMPASRGGGSILPSFSFGEVSRFSKHGAAPSGEMAPPEPPPPIDPDDTWLDFDTLLLGEVGDRSRRGRLVRSGGPATDPRGAGARHEIDAMPPPPRARDPLETRGVFDHRYDARGIADVPSDGRVHRVPLATAEAEVRLKLRVVPRESPDVFREAEVKNPFDAPLLAGPVDVFVEGALLTTSEIGAVDRGGVVALGLGVEERVRAARNARVEETSAGLLGGSSAIEHAITIDLTSSLGAATPVEIIERVPVSDDKGVEVVSLGQTPPAEAYDQAERGHPVRGGLRWRLELPPGAKQRVEFRYRVTLSAKSEVVGGNRRE